MLAGSSNLQRGGDLSVQTAASEGLGVRGGAFCSPFVHVVLLSLSLPQFARSLAVAEVVGGRLPPGAAVFPLFAYKQQQPLKTIAF